LALDAISQMIHSFTIGTSSGSAGQLIPSATAQLASSGEFVIRE
jgi:hypothetical protein